MSGTVPGLPDIPSEPTYGWREMTTTTKKQRGKTRSSWLLQAAVVGAVLLGLICVVPPFLLSCVPRKTPGRQSTTAIELRRESGPREFRYSELAAATDNFAEERKIGTGGFGQVYRGYLSLSGQDRNVAIKVPSQEQITVRGRKAFEAEVNIMRRLRHRNIVQLLGWCPCRGRLALVYELVPGGSLHTHLYSPGRHLTWPERIVDAVDRRLGDEFDRQQMKRLLLTGLWCAHHDPMQRPSIALAMAVLRS